MMNNLSLRKIIIFIFFWGCALSATQVVLLREYLCAGGGNEISMGLMLSFWLLFNAIGAFLSGLKSGLYTGRPNILPVLGFFLTSFSVLILRYARIIFGVEPGVLLNIQIMVFLALISISLPAILSGLSFPYLSKMLGVFKKETGAAYVYGIESLGLVLGYIISVLLIKIGFNHLAIITILYGICFLFLFTADRTKVSIFMISLATFLLVVSILTISIFDDFTIKDSFKRSNPGFGFIAYSETNYNRYILSERNNQQALFTNNHYSRLIGDDYNSKMIAHLIMSVFDKSGKVLVIGEVSYDIIKHISEHRAETDYVDYDSDLLFFLKRYSILPEKKFQNLSLIYDDGRRYVKSSNKKYNLIFLDLPDPLSLQMNRYFTVEFFSEVRRALDKDGLLVVPLPSILATPSSSKRDYSISVFMSLKKIFPSIKVIEYDRTYLLASVMPLELNFEKLVNRFKDAKISGCDFEPEIFSLALQEENNHRIWEIFEKGVARSNSDFEPEGMLKGLILWEMSVSSSGESILQKISGSFLIVFSGIIFLIFLVAFIMRRKRSVSAANLMFWQGFISMALELIIIYKFQIQSGTLYYYMALLFSSFMAGLFIGSFMTKHFKIPNIIFPLGNIFLSLILFLFTPPNFSLFLLLLWNGLLTGLLFGKLSLVLVSLGDSSVERAASLIDYADCLGGMFSAAVIPLMFIPTLGIKNSLIILVFTCILQLIYSCQTNLSEK